MIATPRVAHPLALLACLLLAACAGKPRKPEPPSAPRAAPAQPSAPPAGGGLYAPHIKDGGPDVPPDVSGIAEPVPRAEPLSRYGNRSPYVVLGKTYHVLPSAEGYVERGIASWYGTKFHGRPTSSFEPYDMYKLTAAHKSLPLPSFARVTNLENGRSLVVRVNDRGPFHDDRLIDLSYAAAVRLGVHVKGTAQVEVRAIVPDGAVVAPAAPGADAGYRWLQVASFSEPGNARKLEVRLGEAGFHRHRVVAADLDGRKVWRVQVGPLADEAALRDAERALQRAGFGAPQRVRP